MLILPDLNRSSSASRCGCSMSPWISPDWKPCFFRLLFSSRTVVLRLAKMIAVRTSSCRSRRRSASRFLKALVGVGTRYCLMLRLVEAGRDTSIVLGLSRNLSASFLIGGGIVAENSSVCRCLGSLVQISSMSGMNPMSSMRSASSMTSIEQPVSRILPRPNRSIRRPGVAISTSTPFSSALIWSPIDTPPISRAIESLWPAPYFSKFSATCAASSRVGSRMRLRGMRARLRPCARMSIIGSTKAAVLPVPVCAMPIRSRIMRTLGIACAWIGVGSL